MRREQKHVWVGLKIGDGATPRTGFVVLDKTSKGCPQTHPCACVCECCVCVCV